MRRVYIWGAGGYSKIVYSLVDKEICVVEGFIDSDKSKQNSLWGNKLKVYPPEHLAKLDYDYIILSMQEYESAENKCKELGIPREKVISYWKDLEATGIFRNRTLEILEERRKRKIYEYRLDSAPYEWGIKKIPKIETAEKLLKKIIQDQSSLCRFGDGEFEIMRGKDRPWFQEKSETLRNRLLEVIQSKDKCINIAIAQNFSGFDKYKQDSADVIREYMAYETRNDILSFINMQAIYYDAYVTRPYIIYKDKDNADIIFLLFKKLWEGRSLLIVEGEYGRTGIGNDLFGSAFKVRRIVCPYKNAWSKYDRIKQVVMNTARKEDLICISLGPTATVLAHDLAKEGYQAIDIGQIDNEYDWYIRGVEQRMEIEGKVAAEYMGNGEIKAANDEIYCSQVIEII